MRNWELNYAMYYSCLHPLCEDDTKRINQYIDTVMEGGFFDPLVFAPIFKEALSVFNDKIDVYRVFKFATELPFYALDHLLKIANGEWHHSTFDYRSRIYNHEMGFIHSINADRQGHILNDPQYIIKKGRIKEVTFNELYPYKIKEVINNPIDKEKCLKYLQSKINRKLYHKRFHYKKPRVKKFEESAVKSLNILGVVYNREVTVSHNKKRYRVDFYIQDLDIFLEIDEKHHKRQVESDRKRQEFIEAKTGKKVYRIEAKTEEQVYKDTQKLVNELCLN